MRYGILFLLLGCTRVMAQRERTFLCNGMRVADSLLTRNDTAAALHEYEELDRLYPIEVLSSGACLKIGKVYMAQCTHRTEKCTKTVSRHGFILLHIFDYQPYESPASHWMDKVKNPGTNASPLSAYCHKEPSAP